VYTKTPQNIMCNITIQKYELFQEFSSVQVPVLYTAHMNTLKGKDIMLNVCFNAEEEE
jgi:hypothetical protein